MAHKRKTNKMWEEYMPVLCVVVFGGVGDGDGPEIARRHHARACSAIKKASRNGIEVLWAD